MEQVAVFDIGSNAIRMARANIDPSGSYTVKKLVRMPIRLGTEIFQTGKFSTYTIDYMAKTFTEFRDVMVRNNITRYRAVATSAYRDATNSNYLEDKIYAVSGIKIEGISGDTEASMIYSAIENAVDIDNGNYLLADIGGGSLELSLIKNGDMFASKSFDVGTVRLLEMIRTSVVDDNGLLEMLDSKGSDVREFIEHHFNSGSNVELIGTGGNFRSMMKLKKSIYNADAEYIIPDELKNIYYMVLETPIIERSDKFSIRRDRADVILPAIGIALLITKSTPIGRIKCPNIGLINGILLDSSSFRDLG